MKSYFGTGSFKKRRACARKRARLDGRTIVAESPTRIVSARVNGNLVTVCCLGIDENDEWGALNETRIETFLLSEFDALSALVERSR